MEIKSLVMLMALLLLSDIATAETYKCIGPNGSIGFQATPCSAGMSSSKVEGLTRDQPAENSDFAVIEAQIPMGVGMAHVPSLAEWDSRVIQPSPDAPPTIRFSSPDPSDPMTLLITFLPNVEGKQLEPSELIRVAKEQLKQYVPTSVEQQIRLETIDTTLGSGVYSSFNERKYQGNVVAPPGDFSTVTAGLIWHPKVVVTFTILSNGMDSAARELAMTTVGGFVVVGGAPASTP